MNMRKINGYFRTMEHTLKSLKTYRYEIQVPQSNVRAPKMIIALHGYGQLVKYFIRKFEALSSEYLIVCPEGPHRFYLKGSSGRVGASWMTKEAREMDIEDNVHWLNALIDELKEHYTPDSITLLGFSQGAATAARWYQQNPKQFDQLILWAAVFPPDIERGTFTSNHSMHFVLGNQDEYYQGSDAEALKNSYLDLGFKVHDYEGTHDIDSKVLTKILALPFHGI
jgi:predicted esterase